MNVDCLHLIKLNNLQENVIITHQILLIKGVVENFKCYKEREIELIVEGANILTTGISKDTGKFKFFIDLGEENKTYLLKFCYCETNLIVKIIYQTKVSTYKIQPLLILSADEQEQCENVKLHQQIIDLNLLLIQSVYAEKLKEVADNRLTFVYNDRCKIFNSKLQREEIYQLNEQDLWLQFAKEILETDWGKRNELKFIAFINCSNYLGEEVSKSKDYSYENIRRHIRGHAALGAGGLALFSTIYFYSWPNEFKDILYCFQNQQELNLDREPDDSNYRKTRAGVYASSLGAVCHEIGHIFDLGHDLHGVMGSNFDYINRVFTIQTKTEVLPERIVDQKYQTSTAKLTKERFTRLKNPTNSFLQRYREQQENDSFYFSKNSAIILSYHAWLRNNNIDDFQSKIFDVEFDKQLNIIKSIKIPLKIVEIRECTNSLVKEWFDLQKTKEEPPTYEFHLKSIQKYFARNYYLFIMSVYGHTKKIDI